jgi:hypothetical protein
MPTTNTSAIYRQPYLTTATFALGLLLFLLPFFNIQCSNVTMARLSGISLATGGKPSVTGDLESLQNGFGNRRLDYGDEPGKTKMGDEGHLFITALAALILGVVGLALSLVSKGRNQRLAMMVGMLGAVALIASWIEVVAYVKTNARSGSDNSTSDFSGMVNVSASPTFWFFLSLVCFAASAYISYKRSHPSYSAEVPPRTAPQIKIENPGEQSEFPAAPHEERDLG